jgi:hypothetical protein
MLVLLFKGIVAILTIVVGIFATLLINHIRKSALRKDIPRESYPLENTIKLAANVHRDLDYAYEASTQQISEGKESVVWNLFGLPWMLATANLSNIEYVLKNVDIYGKGPIWAERFYGLLGTGIFNSDGAVWYKHRRISANLFKLSSFKNEILNTFFSHSIELAEVIHSKGSTKFDIQVSFFLTIFTSILYYLSL